MSSRPPAFQPPDQPDIDVPSVSPALNKGTGTRSIGDRMRFWRALAVLCLLAAGAAFGAWHAVLTFGFDPWAVGFWLIVVETVLGIGIAWVLLTFRQDLLQLRYMRDLWDVQLTALERGLATQRRTARAWSRRWNSPPTRERVMLVNDGEHRAKMEALKEQQAQDRVVLARLQATINAVLSATAAPCAAPPDQDTRELPETGPVAAEYFGGPMQRIVLMALRGEAISVRALVPRWMTRDQHDAAKARLLAAGVLVGQGRGKEPRLAPDVAGLGEDAAHERAIARLAALPSPTGTARARVADP